MYGYQEFNQSNISCKTNNSVLNEIYDSFVELPSKEININVWKLAAYIKINKKIKIDTAAKEATTKKKFPHTENL